MKIEDAYNLQFYTNLNHFISLRVFRWFVDGNLVPGNHGTEHRIPAVDRKFHNQSVKCEVNNVIGKSEATLTLDVHCKYSSNIPIIIE